MKNLYMVIGKSELFLYEREGSQYNKQYIEGNPGFSYEFRSIENNISELLDALVNENNLEGRNEIQFTLIRKEDDRNGEKVQACITNHVSTVIGLKEVIENYIHQAILDGIPMIDEYGINYDGNNYRMRDEKVTKSDFDLLGLTVSTDSLMEVFKK